MKIETTISWGYVELLRTFFTANNLNITCEERIAGPSTTLITLDYDENSDTAIDMTFMGVKHLGFENMLCDYLIRCGIPTSLISVGRMGIKRDMKKLDQEWEEHRRKLGFR